MGSRILPHFGQNAKKGRVKGWNRKKAIGWIENDDNISSKRDCAHQAMINMQYCVINDVKRLCHNGCWLEWKLQDGDQVIYYPHESQAGPIALYAAILINGKPAAIEYNVHCHLCGVY